MKPETTPRLLVLMAVLTLFALCLLAISARAQLTITGTISGSNYVTGLLYFAHDSSVAPIRIRGKRHKYHITLTEPNCDFLLTFNGEGRKKAIYIHTWQPDSFLIRQTIEMNVRLTPAMPDMSVIYYDPATDQYAWADTMPADARTWLNEKRSSK